MFVVETPTCLLFLMSPRMNISAYKNFSGCSNIPIILEIPKNIPNILRDPQKYPYYFEWAW